jgi:uncharacterized membrane protein YhaH (DUF805 family)
MNDLFCNQLVILSSSDIHFIRLGVIIGFAVIYLIIYWISSAVRNKRKSGKRHERSDLRNNSLYMKCWRQYADFSGRARRKEYWMFQIFNILIVVAAAMFVALLSSVTYSVAAVIVFATLTGLFCLAIFIPGLAVLVRRLHDTGKSGWWMFISLVPLVGSLWLLVLLLTEGERGSNEYGPDPKAADDSGRTDSYVPTEQAQPFGEYNRRTAQPVQAPQQTKISIGRDYSCNIRVDNSFDDVSRNHATLAMKGDTLMFEDNSTNGSYVNGQRVHHSQQPVCRGDKIVLGKNYTLSWSDINLYFPDGKAGRKTDRFR